MLLPGRMSIACSPVSFSPHTTLMTDCPCRWSPAKAAASAAVTVIAGPDPPAGNR
jgi:hypothetical protein